MPQDLFSQIYGVRTPEQDLFSSIYGVQTDPQEDAGFLQPIKTAVGSAFEFLNRPSRAVAEGVHALQKGTGVMEGVKRGLAGESKLSFEDVLGEAGMEKGWGRTLTGLGLDIATDPLNLVGGLPFKAVRAVADLPAAGRVAQAVKDIPLVEAAGKRFVPFYNLPEEYKKGRRLLESEIQARRGEAYGAAIDRFKGISPAQAKQITLALDKPGGSTGVEHLDELLGQQRGVFEAQKEKEIAAGVLDPEKVKDNYVTYLFKGPIGESAAGTLRKNLSAKNPFGKTRDLVSIEQALYLGAEPHIARIAAVRQATGDRAVAVANFFRDAATKFSLPVEAAPAGFRQVNIASDMPVKEVFKGRAFDPAIADDLEKMVAITASPDALSELARAATGVWKGYATAANPGFHFRNLVSNVFNSWLGGLNPAMVPMRYAEAAAAAKGAIRPIGAYSPDQIAKAMVDYGVVGTGHGAFGDVTTALDKLVSSTKGAPARFADQINPLSSQNLLQQGGRAVGNAVENLSRRALFLDQLHKGASLEDAALHVRKYLFDYSELTDFEKQIRNTAVPFYTWLRKNLPLQLENLLSQPAKYAHVGKGVAEVEEATEEAGLSIPQGERPEWLQRQDAVQLPFTTDKGEKLLFNPDLPFQDLDLLPVDKMAKGQPGGAATEVGKSALSMLNPWLKIPIELSLNKEAFTDREIVPRDIGPDAVVRAPAFLATLAEQSPELAEKLGMHKSISRRGEEEWVMPARAAYLASQVPFFTKLGKAMYEQEGAGRLPLPGSASISPGQASYMGFGFTPIDDLQQAQSTASRLRGQIQELRNSNRQRARFINPPPTRMDDLLRWVLEGGVDR